MLNAIYETDRVEVMSGETQGYPQPTDSGRPHVIHRCAACGTAMWSNYGGLTKLRFVRVGTLEEPSALKPDLHIYTRSKQPWIVLPAGVPAFEAYYNAKELWPAESLERRKTVLG